MASGEETYGKGGHSLEKVMYTVDLLVQFGVLEVTGIDPQRGPLMKRVRDETPEEAEQIDKLVAEKFGRP